MIDIFIENDILLLRYESIYGDFWTRDKLDDDNHICVSKIFTFTKEDLFHTQEEKDTVTIFSLGLSDITSKYYMIEGRKLQIRFNVYFDKRIDIDVGCFVAIRNISIFKGISAIMKNDIIIGFDEDSNLNIETFYNLINQFPNSYELKKYANMRVSAVIRNELDTSIDASEAYEKYMNKKILCKTNNQIKIINDSEKTKYEYLRDKLIYMLDNQGEYVEKQWQHEILKIIEIVFPKYVAVLEEVSVTDVYTNSNKRVDYILIDFNGNIDIIEIKRPYSNPILTRTQYRNNYVPLRELSGTIMQIEKYLFFLNKWGKEGEVILNRKYKSQLFDIELKIINPCGIIIMGRDSSLSNEQMKDFEIIKRKYNNILDIITYDDLLRRLNVLITKFA